jgi:endoglucanase
MKRSVIRAIGLVAVAVAAALAPASASGAGNPFAGATLFVDPDSNAARQADAWRGTRPLDAATMERIAAGSQADWFGDWNSSIEADVDARVSQIAAAGSFPVLVAYNITNRDCGGYSSGGASSPREYRRWIRGFAGGIGRRRAAVVLEPDAVAAAECLDKGQRRRRFRMLRRAVRALDRRTRASVYIDAGHSGWQPPRVTIRRLRRAGVASARGFSLNVSNFQTTESELAYGGEVATRLGEKHFVVDTSRNGLGPAPDGAWCNPPGRGLGQPATASTADPLADAYLWIKSPGESDGTCNGGPPAGVWWPEYALGLAQRAQGG